MRYSLKEHQAKRLVPKDVKETIGVITDVDSSKIEKFNESYRNHLSDIQEKKSDKEKDKRKLIVKMEAIHTGITRNFTNYTEHGLKGGLQSWTQPYQKPVLTHHNEYDGEAIGRILEASYTDKTMSGKGALVFTVEITDEKAIEKVLDGRYQTVSIGATTDKVTCSACGTDRTEDWCDHYPGEEHDGQTVSFIIGNTFGREVSYVNTPSDQYAGNRSVEVVKDDDKEEDQRESVKMEVYQMAEGLFQNIENPDINLYENLNENVKGMIDALMNVKERSDQDMDPKENQTPENQAPEGQVKEDQKPEGQVKEEEKTPDNGGAQAQTTHTQVSEGTYTDVSEANAQIKFLEKRISEMQGTISDLVMKESKLNGKINDLESDNQRLVDENAALIGDEHKNLAEKVVDKKTQLRKSDVIGKDREEAVADHIKRTKESLNDSLQDLEEELKNAKPEAGSVENPGFSGDTKESGEEGKETKYTYKEAEDIMKSIFSFGKKK